MVIYVVECEALAFPFITYFIVIYYVWSIYVLSFCLRVPLILISCSLFQDVQFGPRQRIARVFHVLSSVCAFALVLTGIYAAYSQSNLRLPLSLSVEFCLKLLSDRVVPLLIFGTFAKIAAIFISGLIRCDLNFDLNNI